MTQNSAPLLDGSEPAAVEAIAAKATSALLLTCDHASNRIPHHLGSLGLPPQELSRHIAYDIGARDLTLGVGAVLGAMVILQNYSRLVIDCNRPLTSPESIVLESDQTPIPGNVGLSQSDVQQRQRTIFEPYHRRIAAELDRRQQAGQPTLIIAMHSFTPSIGGKPQRPWHAGTLYREDRRAAVRLRDLLRREPQLVIGDNEPYAIGLDTDYSLPVHGEARGLLHVGLEVRQDLIAEPGGQEKWSARLAGVFAELCRSLQL